MAKQNNCLNPPSRPLRSKPHSSPDGAAAEAREVHCLVNAPFFANLVIYQIEAYKSRRLQSGASHSHLTFP